ncbi:MarR family winged helix-turn-helix transcriptional regulator [Kitasatospora sp. NPDC059146]|uniref:MarR family winged helix-turn-helix transcriptional regulator n=1 Tax=unclassified Kitasatospora TaxID=2633591 RepID=UPI0035E3AA81
MAPPDQDVPSRRLGHLLKQCEQTMMAARGRALRTVGLTVPQYLTLRVLAEHPDASGAQLARHCLVTPQTMATRLASLEGRGLVRRQVSSVHSHVFTARLTEEGRALTVRGEAAEHTAEQRLVSSFLAEEVVVFRSLLRRAVAAVSVPEADPVGPNQFVRSD